MAEDNNKENTGSDDSQPQPEEGASAPAPDTTEVPQQETNAQGAAPEVNAPESASAEGNAPEGAAPEGSAPESASAEGSAPEGASPEATSQTAPAAPVADAVPTPAPRAKKTKKESPAPAASSSDPLSLDPNQVERPKIIKAKGSKNVASGVAHVLATFNNTIVSITDPTGNVLGWSSAGKVGFKGSRKSTAYAAQMVAQDACRQAMSHGVREVEVRVKGPGAGRESAVRAMQAIGLEIAVIRDVTPVPHNGCRPPKQRRV